MWRERGSLRSPSLGWLPLSLLQAGILEQGSETLQKNEGGWIFREEVRAEMRTVAALSNVELIAALLSCNRQLAFVGLQLRIINGVVSLLTTEVNNKALAHYLSEQNDANGISGLTTSALEVLACIAFRQPISQAEIDRLFDADKRGLVVKLRDLHLVEKSSRVATVACALRQPKRSCSALASQTSKN